MSKPRTFVFIGLSLTSSWGNGHATTYRALIRGLAKLGHEVLFLERDVPWYANNRDLPKPDFCQIGLYRDLRDLRRDWGAAVREADAVIVGSFVPDGIAVAEWVLDLAKGVTAFYDIDTPVTLAKLRQGEMTYINPALIRTFDLYLSFTGGPTLRRLEREFGARRAEALYCAVDETRYRAAKAKRRWDLSYLGTYSADRQPALERLLLKPARLLPECRFVVAGPQYPTDIDWPDNVERIEHLAPEQHARFYCRSRFTLNITRSDMIAAGWSPSVRLFEAAACGRPIISDRWSGLDELFPERRAILIAEDTEDVLDALTHTDPTNLAQIGERARRIIVRSHTGTVRAKTLLQFLGFTADQPGQHQKATAAACEATS